MNCPKRRFSAVLSLLAFALVFAGAIPHVSADETKTVSKETASQDVFGSDKIWTVDLTIPAEEYEAMQPRGGFGGQQSPMPLKVEDPPREVHRNAFGVDLPWAKGAITVDGQTFEGVGIRYKGNGSIGDTARTIKKSFKVELDHFQGKKTFRSLKTLNLHCDVTDPSRFRETLGYGLYRAAGVPAPQTAWAEVRLTVPGKFDKQLLGVYTLVEQVNKPFLKEHFQNDKGLLMKPEGLRDFTDRGDDWGQYQRNYVPKRDATADEAKRIMAFAKLVDKADDKTFRSEIASYLDIDNYLRFLATTSFVANTDNFFSLGHNYYLYLHPDTQKIHFIPWDLDRAFANFGMATQNMDLSFTQPYGGSHRLTERLLAMPAIATKYQQILKELATGPFAKEQFSKELQALEVRTKDLLDRDAKAAVERKEVTNGPGAPGGMFGQPPGLATFIEKRTESLVAQLSGKSKGFIPNGGPFGGMFGGPPPGLGMPGRPGEILAMPIQDQLKLTDDQKKQLAQMQSELDGKLDKLLTDEQRKKFKELRERRPGFGPPGFGPPGFGPPGGPPRGPAAGGR